MKKSVSLALFPLLALGIFVGINAFVPRASGEEGERYDCQYDGYQGYNCQLDDEGEFSCEYSNETGWSCRKDGWGSSMFCSENEGEDEGDEGGIYCMREYSCVLEGGESIEEGENSYEGTYHCKIEEGGGFGCSDWDGESYCQGTESYLGNCEHIGDDYYCDKGYSMVDQTESSYYFELSREGGYDCGEEQLLESFGGLRGPSRGLSYTPGHSRCKNDEWEQYYGHCTYDGEGYVCPKMYSYDLDIYEGVYNFSPDMYGNYYCESDSDGEDEGDMDSYTCYYLEDESFYYNNCEKKPPTPIKSDGEGYFCPIIYSCELEDDGYFCGEDSDGDYYCVANGNDKENNEEGELQTYSCFSGLNNLLSDDCYAESFQEKGGNFGGFFCSFNIEKYTITVSTNDNGYGSVNPSGEIGNIPSGTEILIDENNVLTIGGNEVVATPAQSIPEYTYIFNGWTNNCGNTLTGDCTITANFSRIANEYTITFKDGDKTNVYTGTVGSSVVVPNWSKEGYTLSWDNNIPATMPAENLVITAHWTINQYTITFDLNGGSSTINPITQEYNSAVSEPTEPTKEGYTFAGWYDGNSKVIFPYQMPASNKTLTAHWSQVNSGGNGGGYSGGGGGSGGGSSNNHKDDNKQNEDKPVVNSQSTGDNKKLDEKTVQNDDNESKEDDNKTEDGNNDGGINTPLYEEPKYSQETLDAYNWAYANGLTKYSNIKDARLDEYMNRSEMAKISTIFATQFRGEIPDEEKREFCSKFSDLWKVEEDTKEYIIQSCELGNMGYQANGVDELQRFRPYTPVSLAETSIILSRMMWKNKYAVSETKWYQGHLWAVYEHRLIDNISKPFDNITRKDAFVMLYRLSFSNDVIRN